VYSSRNIYNPYAGANCLREEREEKKKKGKRKKENRMETSWSYWLPTVTCH